ncbi:Spy0128 family protein [Enorma massiliensis]|uniref:Spy0128 family protein n=1 Tax=Enorma massiliensis TaxID=1472761 RepID=UPI0023F54A3A|nr:FctA domain-containing protein [Enorma massiliensis]
MYVTIALREVSYQLAGSKVLETNGYAGETLADGEYAFDLYELVVDGSETKIEEVSNGTPNGDAASFQFSPITYTEAGAHTYKVYELGTDGQPGTGGTDADNVFYSTAVYTVTVTVTQSNDGRGLSASAQVTDAEGATASDVLFTNTYTPKEVVVGPSGSAQIGGTKTLAVSDGADCALAEGEFTFVLLDANGDEVRRVTNAADGSFVFDDLTFDAAGTYSYTVAEVNGSAGGIGYDDSLFAVTVKVTEDTDANALVADVSYAKDGATVDAVSFENTYTAASTTASIGAFKQLNGGTLADGQFTFALAGSEGAPMPEGAQDGVATAASAADGTVSFRKGDLAKRLGCGGRLPRGWQLSSCGGFLFAAASRFRVGHFLPSRPERVRCPHAGGAADVRHVEKHVYREAYSAYNWHFLINPRILLPKVLYNWIKPVQYLRPINL